MKFPSAPARGPSEDPGSFIVSTQERTTSQRLYPSSLNPVDLIFLNFFPVRLFKIDNEKALGLVFKSAINHHFLRVVLEGSEDYLSQKILMLMMWFLLLMPHTSGPVVVRWLSHCCSTCRLGLRSPVPVHTVSYMHPHTCKMLLQLHLAQPFSSSTYDPHRELWHMSGRTVNLTKV